MELALDHRADIVNVSIGAALTWPQYPTAKAADSLVRHGVVVVASIGNEGALGLYGASAPGIGKNVIGVASFDNSHVNRSAFTITPDGTTIGYVAALARHLRRWLAHFRWLVPGRLRLSPTAATCCLQGASPDAWR